MYSQIVKWSNCWWMYVYFLSLKRPIQWLKFFAIPIATKLPYYRTILKMWKNIGLIQFYHGGGIYEIAESYNNIQLMVTFLQISETCLSKFNWLSIVIPRRLSESSVVKDSCWSVDPTTRTWCLRGLTIIPFLYSR